MLQSVLEYLGNNCPQCGAPLHFDMEKQLAQCTHCHTHGQKPMALLIQSGMTFIKAEDWINTNRQQAGRQTALGSPATHLSVVGFNQL